MEKKMRKLTVNVVAVALSAAATGAIAQTSPSADHRLMAMPAASDAAIRNSVMDTLTAPPKTNQQSSQPVSVSAASATAMVRGSAPAKP